jgi:glutathione reductase (NADPH)
VSDHELDLFVIGAGSGGVRAARMAAASGARVAVAEARFLGGTCVNVGCVPKKLFVYASSYARHMRDAPGFGWSIGATSFDWSTLRDAKDREIVRLNGVYRGLLEGAGVEIIDGRARLRDAHTVVVGERVCTSDRILVATGGRPVRPAIPGHELGLVSDDMFHLDELPDRIVVLGGGYIAVEFAGILAGLGVDVVQLYRGPMFLRGFDDDIRRALADDMRHAGIDLRFEANVDELTRAGAGVRARLTDGNTVEADAVLFATGRLPNTADLGLEEVGVGLESNGAVVVDPHSRTTVPGIFAVGDCTDRMALTPVALAEAMAFVRTEFLGEPTTVDYAHVPTAVFSQPQIGTVGLTECEARAVYHDDVEIYRSQFRPMQHTLSGREETTVMKLVVRRSDRKVLGVHVLGADAAEIVQGFAVALVCGATKEQLDRTIGIHPTAAEELVTMRQPVA